VVNVTFRVEKQRVRSENNVIVETVSYRRPTESHLVHKSSVPFVLASLVILVAGSVAAQEVDNTQILPDARPGDCFAKVITPARFTTRSEEVVVQEASERIETIPAEYETVERSIVVKEASEAIDPAQGVFEEELEEVELRPAETHWVGKTGPSAAEFLPASPGALEGIERSGVDLGAVEVGMCFREYFTDAEYRSAEQRVLVKEATQSIEVTDAVYETVDERVLVKEASSQVVDVPAVYRTETESVLVEPSRSVWKTDCGIIEQVANTTGDVMCLVEVPARYETLSKTVLDRPATTKTIRVPAEYRNVKVERLVTPASEKRIEVPAEYKTVETRVKIADAGFFWLATGEDADSEATWNGHEVCLVERPAETESIARQILAKPASANVVEVPARYESIKVQRLLKPATERRIEIPARTRTVTSQVQVEPSRLEWRKVLCQANMTPGIISSLQRALKREGFDPGPIDGLVGQTTMRAVERFQTEKDLDRGGITYETLKQLKVQS